MIAFLFAITSINNMMTPYSGYTKELHPTADRAISLLIEDEGIWESPNMRGTNWEIPWIDESYDYVGRIGFSESKDTNNIDYRKISVIMESSGEYWEYPTNATTSAELDNASRALGIERYHFYMQIRPVDMDLVNENNANQRVKIMVGNRGDVVSVVRYSILNQRSFGDFDGAYILGFQNPSKPLFGLDQANFSFISDRLKFTIYNWSISGNGQNSFIQNIAMDESIKKVQARMDKNDFLDGTQFTAQLNGEDYTDIKPNGNMKMKVTSASDNTTFSIPVSTIEEYFGQEWRTSVEVIYIQLNVQKLEVSETGVTWFSNNIDASIYPIQTILWVW